MADNNAKGYDATDAGGDRYQIKARRLSPGKNSKPLGVVHDLDAGQFDHLAVVLFDHEYGIALACPIPYEEFCRIARPTPGLNGHRISAGPGLLSITGAVDFTGAARTALAALE
ncbi:MAG: hypothetical protein U1F44_02565 [Coriobacteriia bacterium]|nr:hypothetical protein [Coriobacteriia bacterium]